MAAKIAVGFFGLVVILAAFVSGCSHDEAIRSGPSLQVKAPIEAPIGLEEVQTGIPREGPAPASEKLTLERAMEEALAASPELEQIQRRIDAASEQVRQAEALFYPRFAFVQDYGLTNQPGAAFMYIINQRRFQQGIDFNNPGVQQNFTTGFKGELEVFSGGADWYGRKASQAQRRGVSAEYNAYINQLVSKVTRTYLQWLQALGFTGVAERALESAGVSEEIGAARVSAQTALPSELTRLKVRTAEATSDLVSAKTGARRLQAAMERLMARPVRPEEVPEPEEELKRPARENPAGEQRELVDRALGSRPEMASAAALIQAARERVRSSRSGFLPRISAQAIYQWDSEGMGNMPESWLFGLQAKWPLFEGGASLSRMREAKARLGEMEARGRQIALDIALEVHQATLAVEEAVEKIHVSEARKNWADKALSETRHLYRDQAATIDALLQAEVASNQADVARTAALFDGRIAHTALMLALGAFTDWTEKQK